MRLPPAAAAPEPLRDGREKGWRRPVASLFDRITANDETTHIDAVSLDEAEMRMGRRSRPETDLMPLRSDVDRAVDGLPRELADVARLLAAGESVVDIAKQLQVSRATVHRRIVQLRQIFRRAGLHDYVGECKEVA